MSTQNTVSTQFLQTGLSQTGSSNPLGNRNSSLFEASHTFGRQEIAFRELFSTQKTVNNIDKWKDSGHNIEKNHQTQKGNDYNEEKNQHRMDQAHTQQTKYEKTENDHQTEKSGPADPADDSDSADAKEQLAVESGDANSVEKNSDTVALAEHDLALTDRITYFIEGEAHFLTPKQWSLYQQHLTTQMAGTAVGELSAHQPLTPQQLFSLFSLDPAGNPQRALSASQLWTTESHPLTGTALSSALGSALHSPATTVNTLAAEPGLSSIGTEGSGKTLLTMSLNTLAPDQVLDTAILSGNTEQKMADTELLLKTTDTQQTVRPLQQPAMQQPQPVVSKPAVVQTSLLTPVSNSKWSGALHDRVMWLASQNVQAAEIHLDPPELGPLQVKITMNQDQAQVSFVSHHASVREALDQGAVRLRELFEQNGLDLANVDVSDQSHSQDSFQESSDSGESTDPAHSARQDTTAPDEADTLTGAGLVDHYV